MVTEVVQPPLTWEELPDLPAHPRCRCTIRAVYRDDQGRIFGSEVETGAVTEPPTSPQPPQPTVGFEDALARLMAVSPSGAFGGLARPYAPAFVPPELRAEIEAMPPLTRAQIDTLVHTEGGTNAFGDPWPEGSEAFRRWGAARYGFDMTDSSNLDWSPFQMGKFIETMELARANAPDVFQRISDARFRIEGTKGAPFVAATSSGRLIVNLDQYTPNMEEMRVEGADRWIEPLLHELGHAVMFTHPEPGLSRRGEPVRTGLWSSWYDVVDSASNIAPAPSAERRIANAITQLQSQLDRGEINFVYQGLARDHLQNLQRALAEMLAPGGGERYPTNYAVPHRNPLNPDPGVEDFAEAFQLYQLAPAQLRAWSPAHYAWLRDHIFAGKEFVTGPTGADVVISRVTTEESNSIDAVEETRQLPHIARSEATLARDVERRGVEVVGTTPVSGRYDGGAEPSVALDVRPESVEQLDETLGYLVQRNRQQSAIVTITGEEIARLGLQPNGVEFVISDIPDSRMSEFYDRLGQLVPAATVDRAARTASYSSYDEGMTDELKAGFVQLAREFGARLALYRAHIRWMFSDRQQLQEAQGWLAGPADAIQARTVRVRRPARSGAPAG